MIEVHAPMTALEARCEEELTSIPGWHSELEKIEHAKGAKKPEEKKQDKAVEESMILGT